MAARIKSVFTIVIVICLTAGFAAGATLASDLVRPIPIPWKGMDPAMPHLAYTGSSITVKAVAKGLVQDGYYQIDCNGDNLVDTRHGNELPYTIPVYWRQATPSRPFIDCWFSYSGDYGRRFIASSQMWETTYKPPYPATVDHTIRLCESTDPGSAEHMQVRFDVSVDEALWALHKSMTKGVYAAGAPGYGQPYGCWNNSVETTALAVAAFVQWGVKPDGNPDLDPYVEDLKLGLNYLLVNLHVFNIGVQNAGNPDSNGNGIGLCSTPGANGSILALSKTLLAFASIAQPDTVAGVGSENICGRSYADIATDMADYLAWAQGDVGKSRGGWSLWPNDSSSIIEVTPWPVLALKAAEQKLGITLHTFIRSELQNFVTADQYLGEDPDNGCFRWDPDYYTNYGCQSASCGIVLLDFLGIPSSDSRIQRAIGYLYRHWNDQGALGSNQGLLGCSEAMFMTMNAFAGLQQYTDQVTEYDYNANIQTQNSFNWIQTPNAQVNQGIGHFITSTQNTPERSSSNSYLGYWFDNAGGGSLISRSSEDITAVRALTLLTGGKHVLPDTAGPKGILYINDAYATQTDNTKVVLNYDAWDVQSGVTYVRFRNERSLRWSVWYSYNGISPAQRAWTLDAGNGEKTVYAQFKDAEGNISAEISDSIILAIKPVTVTVNQAENQKDPSVRPFVLFTVEFSEPVTGFDSTDVVIGGSTAASKVSVSGVGTSYQLLVSGMVRSGNITVSIPAGAAINSLGTGSEASTSTDNEVTYKFLRVVGSNLKAVSDPIMRKACGNYQFKLWGRMENPDGGYFELSDGSDRVRVYAPGYELTKDTLMLTGVLDFSQGSPLFISVP